MWFDLNTLSVNTDIYTFMFAPKNNTLYRLNKFYLTVSFTLGTSDNFDINKSYSFSKNFNFIDGSEQIISDGLGVNPNPYVDSNGDIINKPDQYPSGSGSSGSSSGAGVNVVVNNNNSRLPLNVQSDEELDQAIARYGFVFQRTKEFFDDITEETSNNNFLQLIADTYPQVPYLDFMMTCCMSVIGMGVIIFILKALLK